MSQEMESSSRVANIVNQMDVLQKPGEYISRNGIVFKLKKVSRLLILDATKKILPPEVPVIYLEDKGRKEENPSDPIYIQKMQDYNAERGLLTSTLIVAFGSEVIHLTEDYIKFESPEWEEDLKDFGVDIPIKGKARYAAWVKYHLLDDEDVTDLIRSIMRFSGITIEEDVNRAEANFRGN